MSVTKRVLKSDALQVVLSWLAAIYLRLVYMTTRWIVLRPPATQDVLARGQPFIACFWHGRMAVMRAAIPPNAKIHMLISEHRDGLLISRAVVRLGVNTVPGSSKRGGLVALRAIQRLLERGQSVAITPDGPRGPRMRAKAGALKAAQLSGVPILPVSGSVSRRRVLRSWDRFCLALPFAHGAIFWGEPIVVPREADDAELERLRDLLEERLNALTAEADRHFGQPAIAPASLTETEDRPSHARA